MSNRIFCPQRMCIFPALNLVVLLTVIPCSSEIHHNIFHNISPETFIRKHRHIHAPQMRAPSVGRPMRPNATHPSNVNQVSVSSWHADSCWHLYDISTSVTPISTILSDLLRPCPTNQSTDARREEGREWWVLYAMPMCHSVVQNHRNPSHGLMSWSILYVVEFCIRLLSKLESLSASSQMWSNSSSHLRGKQCRDNFYEYMWQLQEEYVQGVVLSHWKFERRFRYPKDCRRTDTSSFSLLSGLRFEISSH